MNLVSSMLAVAFVLQAPLPDRSIVAEKMKALSFLVGRWEGVGKIQIAAAPRVSSDVRENVQYRLSGQALLVEGLGTVKSEDGKSDQPVHEAIGLITWDLAKEKYVMHVMTAKAGAVEPTVEVGDKTLVWSFVTDGRTIRYTIKINEKGQWIEDGEWTIKGEKWLKFLEMTLDKKG